MVDAPAFSRRHFLKIAAAGAIAGALLPLSVQAEWQALTGPLPQISVPKLTGGEIGLRSLAGRVVLVNFWATWCPPCLDEFPDLVHLQRQYGPRGLTVVAINHSESAAKVRKFLQQVDISESEIPIGLDNAGMASKSWRVRALPTSFLIDRRGKPLRVWNGEINADDPQFIAGIEALLK